jgi:hypothetical protein
MNLNMAQLLDVYGDRTVMRAKGDNAAIATYILNFTGAGNIAFEVGPHCVNGPPTHCLQAVRTGMNLVVKASNADLIELVSGVNSADAANYQAQRLLLAAGTAPYNNIAWNTEAPVVGSGTRYYMEGVIRWFLVASSAAGQVVLRVS